MMRKIERENTGLMQPGQDLVVAGYAGLAGTCMLVRARRAFLGRWFSDEYLDSILAREDALVHREQAWWLSLGAAECEPAGEGGILTAIWNLSGAYGTGVEFALRRIPVRQETIEVCERLELNPYRLYADGCCLLAAANGGQLVEKLAREGIFARVIGRVNSGIAREIVSEDGHGFLERPQPDELQKGLEEMCDERENIGSH